jgi:hypothetical protein
MAHYHPLASIRPWIQSQYHQKQANKETNKTPKTLTKITLPLKQRMSKQQKSTCSEQSNQGVWAQTFFGGMGHLVQVDSPKWPHEELVCEHLPASTGHRVGLGTRIELFGPPLFFWKLVTLCSLPVSPRWWNVLFSQESGCAAPAPQRWGKRNYGIFIRNIFCENLTCDYSHPWLSLVECSMNPLVLNHRI